MTNLIKQGVAAVKWGTFSSVARFGLQIFSQAVMARALGPEIYGVFGMGLIVLTFANFFAEFGFGWTLIYSKEIHPEDVRFAFTCQMLTGGLVSLGMYTSAGLIAQYFHEPRVEVVVHWIAITCLISAATAPSMNLLARDMRFRESGIVQIISYFVGYVLVGIPLAISNFGITALIASWITQSVVRLLASYWLTRHPIRLLFVHKNAKFLLTSGATAFITNITNWLLNNIDRMLVGRLLSASSMGFYTVGANVANTPNSLLLSVLQPAFLSAGAKLNDEPGKLQFAYKRILSAALVLTIPIYFTLAAVAPSIVAVLYGARWAGSAPVMSILFLAMPGFIVWGISTPVLWNTGRSSHEALLQWPVLFLACLFFSLFADSGVEVVAFITAMTLSIRGIVMCTWACRAINLSLIEVTPDLGRGIFLGVVCAVVAVAVQHWLSAFPAIVVLLVASAAAGVAGLSLIIWRPTILGEGGCTVVIRFIPLSARWLSRSQNG
jgi:lipopolysaccharide exporter